MGDLIDTKRIESYMESFRKGWELYGGSEVPHKNPAGQWNFAKSMAWAGFHGAMRAVLRPVRGSTEVRDPAEMVTNARGELDALEAAEHAFAAKVGHKCDCPKCAIARHDEQKAAEEKAWREAEKKGGGS